MHYNARNVIKAQYSIYIYSMTYNTSVKMPVWHGRSGEHKWVFCVRLQPTYFVWVRCWMILQYTVGRVHAHTHTRARTRTRTHKSNYNTLMPTYAAYLLISFTDSLPYTHTLQASVSCAHTHRCAPVSTHTFMYSKLHANTHVAISCSRS